MVPAGSVVPGQSALCTDTLAPVQAPSWALTAALSAAELSAAAATLLWARTCEWWAECACEPPEWLECDA